MLHHVSLQVAGLGKGFVAHLTLVGPHALMCEQVCVQVAQLLEQLSTEMTPMWLDAIVTQDMCNQVVLRGVRLLAHPTLPPLLIPTDVHVVAVIHVDTEAQLLCAAHFISGSSLPSDLIGTELLFSVESGRGEVHERPGHEVGIWEKVVGER